MTAPADPLQRFPIRTLAERTGVGTSNLRAWERRYGLLVPERTPKGHRLYGESHVRQVERALSLLDQGLSLSAIASQLGNPAPGSQAEEPAPKHGVWSNLQRRTLEAIEDFDSDGIERIYSEAVAVYPIDLVTERLIEPVLIELGHRWPSRAAGIAEEHFFTSWLRNRVGARFHQASSQGGGPRILCATLPGCQHEIGLMLFALSAMSRGFRLLYLGVDMPLEQLEVTAGRGGVRGILLGARQPLSSRLEANLAALANSLPLPVMLGGPASDDGLPAFEAAGGIRLGSRIAIALRLLLAHLPPGRRAA